MRYRREKYLRRKGHGPRYVPLYFSPGSFSLFGIVNNPGQASFRSQTLPTLAFSLKFLQEGVSNTAL